MNTNNSLSGASDVRPKLSALIKDMCPNGVEWKTIGETLGVNRGKRLTKSELSEDGSYEVYHGSKDTPLGCYTASNAPKDTVIVVNTGGIGGVKYLDKDFWCSDGSFWIGHSDIVNNKFLYYFLSRYEGYFESQKRVGGVPTIDRKVVENFEIPIPPLEIQKIIVECLDEFSALAAELQAELQMRRKQYEYYRTHLLTPHSDCNSAGDSTDDCNWEWKTLGEIGKVCMCKRILKNETNSQSGIPFYKIGTFGGVANAYISEQLYEEYKNRYSYPKKGDILISAAGTIGKSVIFDGEPSYFQDSNIVWIANDEKKVLNKYLYYYYQIVDWKVDDGGVIKRLYNDNLKATPIAVPSLEDQARIVAILEKFEALTMSLSEGIPAEMDRQQKKYEYYRDLLLTFPRKAE